MYATRHSDQMHITIKYQQDILELQRHCLHKNVSRLSVDQTDGQLFNIISPFLQNGRIKWVSLTILKENRSGEFWFHIWNLEYMLDSVTFGYLNHRKLFFMSVLFGVILLIVFF